jgi:drug/metabolite transporter (DMT)-like permease
MRSLGAARSAVIASGEPVFTATLLYLALGEGLAPSQAIGVLAIVLGVALVSAEPAARRGPDGRAGVAPSGDYR